MSLKYVFIIHRQMGCNDEASTDEEQAEKILYFYPYDMSTYGQLTKINMLEGLIEFTNKFSSDSLDVVVMDKHTWGFYEAEKDIWIIAAVDNNEDVEPSGSGNLHTHGPNAYGLQLSIKKLYEMYYSLYGSFAASLGGVEGSGWKSVEAIQLIRKQIRKLNIKLRQQTQDLDTMNELLHPEVIAVDNPDNVSIRQSEQGNIDLRTSESTAIRVSLSNLVTERSLRARTISDLNVLNVRTSEASEHMGIQSHMTTIEQLNEEIAQTNADIAEKRVKLNSLYYDDTFYIARGVRDSLSRFMRLYLSSSGTGLSVAVPGGTSTSSSFDVLRGISLLSFGSSVGCNSSLLRLRQNLESVTKHKCIGSLVLYDGQVVWSDLDNTISHTLTEFIHMQDVLALRTRATGLLELCLGDKARNTGNKFQVTDSEIDSFMSQKLNEVIDGRRGFVSLGWDTVDLHDDAIINGLIHWGGHVDSVNSEQKANKPQNDKDVIAEFCLEPSKLYCPRVYSQGVCVGRILIYRQHRVVMVLLLPDWSTSSFSFDETAVHSFLSNVQHPNSDTAQDKKNHIKVSQFLRFLTIDGGNNNDNSNNVVGVLSNRHISVGSLESTSILAFCASIQQGIHSEIIKLDKAIKLANLKSSADNSKHLVGNGTTVSIPHTRNVNSLNKAMALNSSAHAGARGFVPTSTSNVNVNNSGGNNNTGENSSGASSPLPSHVFSNGLTGSNASTKDIRVIYYNSMSHTVKINNVYDGSISPLVSLSAETKELVLTQLRTKDAYKRKIVFTVSDKLAAEVESRFPHSSELLTSCMEPAVMRALNDIWVEITAKELTQQSLHHTVIEACLRVSTAQRGGIWVTGRKMSDCRYVFLVIDKCATLNEMYELFEDICDGLQSRSLVL